MALAFFGWGCAHAPSGVEGERVPEARPQYEPKTNTEADQALEKAARTAQTSSPQRGIDAYMAVYRAYPRTTAAQEALYRAGLLAFQSGDYANARKSFNQLLFENPLFDKAQDAKLKLGLSAMQLRDYRDAYQTLRPLAERSSGAERTQILEAAERSAEGAQLYAEALRIELGLLDEAKTPEQTKGRLDKVEELIESKAEFVDIARAAEDLSPSSPAWPLLTFKLARIYYHLRDWTRLEETLQKFLKEAPQHPFAAQAQELLTRSRKRGEIRPKVVGAILPMTGRYKPIGEAVMRGISLALKGSDIEIVVKDSQGEPNLAAKAVEELAFDEGAIAILGPIWEDTRRGALVAEELGIPILTFSRTDGITEIGPHVFRNMLTNSAQAKALADYAMKTLGYKSFALMYPNIPYGVDLANKFWDEVTSRGGAIRGAESYAFDQTTFTTEVKKLVGRYYLEDRLDYLEKSREVYASKLDSFRKRKALEKARSQLKPVIDFDAIFIPDAWERVGLVAPALAVEDIVTNACDPTDIERIRKTTRRPDLKTVTLLGSDQWGSRKGQSGAPELIERGGKFVSCSVYVDGFYAESARSPTAKFVEAYRDAYKDQTRPPGLLEATGYDSGRMFRKILQDGRGALDREGFRTRLAAIRDFPGATGLTSFNDHREAEKPLFLLGVDKKEIKELLPDEKLSGSGS
jgi:ABC-type branched-subunit amino acid transport system substrate-binding protein/TolA-binding protein